MEGWVLVLTALGVVLTAMGVAISLVAARAAIQSVKLTRQGLEKQEEQLQLERGLAMMVPELEVSQVSFVPGLSVWEVRDTLEKIRRREREEAERRAWEQSGFGYQAPMLGPFDLYSIAQRDYRGPKPDKVMKIQLKNKGKVAAEDISGSIALDLNRLKILDFPGLDTSEVSAPDENGIHTAEVGSITELLPGKTDELRIALKVHSEQQEAITLKCDFITPASRGTSRDWTIRGPGEAPSER